MLSQPISNIINKTKQIAKEISEEWHYSVHFIIKYSIFVISIVLIILIIVLLVKFRHKLFLVIIKINRNCILNKEKENFDTTNYDTADIEIPMVPKLLNSHLITTGIRNDSDVEQIYNISENTKNLVYKLAKELPRTGKIKHIPRME